MAKKRSKPKERPSRITKSESPASSSAPELKEVQLEQLDAIVAELEGLGVIAVEKLDLLKCGVHMLSTMVGMLELKGATIRRLQKLVFGQKSEKFGILFGPHHQNGQNPKGPPETGSTDTSVAGSTDTSEAGSTVNPSPCPYRQKKSRS